MLEQHEASLSGLRAGLAEIEQSPSYLMLADAALHGETARKYGRATSEAKDLWALISAAESQLLAARNHVNVKGAAGVHGRELQRLLESRWFAITTLKGGQPRDYSVRETMDEIRRRYDAIRAGVTEVDQLWVTVLPRVEAARETLLRLESEAAELQVVEPLIGRARALADDLSERLISDPVSVKVQDGPNLDLQVANAAKQMASLRTGHDKLDADLNSTEELLASLRVLRARADAARTETMAKIASTEQLPEKLIRVPAASLIDGPDGLAARLDRLFENAGTSAWTQKRTLLDAWLSSARKLEAQLTRAEEVNRGPIRRRDELRGRLQAYSAKIAAMGKAEDLGLVEYADRARSELFTAPTDLAAAEEAIAELATRLRG